MLSEKLKRMVEQATVKLTKKGAQGVLVPGGYILTAAHCVDYSCDGSMTQGEYSVEEIETVKGTFLVQCYAIEPVSDIAVLGEITDDGYDTFQYQDFCESVKPVPVHTKILPPTPRKQPMPVPDSHLDRETKAYIYTHEGTWIEGMVKQVHIDAQLFWFDEHSEPIKGGTSGGPIVNEKGELLGVVSTAGYSGPEMFIEGKLVEEDKLKIEASHHPRLCNALPVWLLKRIIEG